MCARISICAGKQGGPAQPSRFPSFLQCDDVKDDGVDAICAEGMPAIKSFLDQCLRIARIAFDDAQTQTIYI